MKVFQTLTTLLLATSAAHALLVPNAEHRSAEDGAVAAAASVEGRDTNSLEKRRGGGGRGGSGGSSGGSSGGRSGSGSSGSSGSGSTGSGSGSSGSGRSGSSSSGAAGRTSANSNSGGTSPGGSGPAPRYGGASGGYYGGGGGVPYAAGARTNRGFSPGLLLLPAAALILLPGLWLYSVYPYHYNQPWRFQNQSAQAQNGTAQNETKPVICLCQEYSSCGCEENYDQEFITSIIGNGSYPALNKTLVNVVDVNGTSTIVINGTLPNGTTADGPDSRAATLPGMGKYGIVYLMGLMGTYLVLFI